MTPRAKGPHSRGAPGWANVLRLQFAVLVIVQCAAGYAADLLEKFRAEYPAAVAKLKADYRRVTIRGKYNNFDAGAATHSGEFEMSRDGDSMLLETAVQ